MIRADNGPELISQSLDTPCEDREIPLTFTQPSKPTQNAYVEHLNGSRA